MLLDLTKKLKSVNGTENDRTLADLTIACLEAGNSGRPRKALGIAYKLAENGQIELDKDDSIFLENCIITSAILSDLSKNAILEEIDKLRH